MNEFSGIQYCVGDLVNLTQSFMGTHEEDVLHCKEIGTDQVGEVRTRTDKTFSRMWEGYIILFDGYIVIASSHCMELQE
jgi:hypothetical protein